MKKKLKQKKVPIRLLECTEMLTPVNEKKTKQKKKFQFGNWNVQKCFLRYDNKNEKVNC